MLTGSLVAIVTPFKSDGAIDVASYKQLVQWHIDSGTDGIVVAGTTGESPALSESEIIQLLEASLEVSSGVRDNQFKVIVGNGAASTEKTLHLTRVLNEYPIDGFLTVCPYYVKPTQKGLIKHFTSVADIARHPVYLYNVPGRTVCDLSNESVKELSQHKSIAGIKDATADLSRVKELITLNEGQFSVLSGDDATSQTFMELGGHGVISVTANIVPELMAQRCHLTLEQKLDEARGIEKNIAALHELLFVEANPIPVKWALAEMRKIEHGLRLPLTSLESGQQALKQELQRLSLVK